MKLLHLLPLAAAATAIVLPDDQVLMDVAIEDHHEHAPGNLEGHFLEDLNDPFTELRVRLDDAIDNAKHFFGGIVDSAADAAPEVVERIQSAAYDVEAWLSGDIFNDQSTIDIIAEEELPDGPHDGPPHHGPPHHGPPHHGPPHHGPPHHGPPHHGPPHHPPHHGHHKSNLTIYQLISKSKYTTKLAKLIDEDKELVDLLNGTSHNYTIFAPTDAAFEKIPKNHPPPTKEQIKAVLLYHISPSLYPARRLLGSHTIPTLHNSTALGDLPQRLSVRVGLRGLVLNFYSKVVAANIFAKNGVIHGVDTIVLPPPSVLTIIGLLPGEFSTLSLALEKTGLGKELGKLEHAGSTFFAPSNFAFKKLGPKINAFLFSRGGLKYLKALMKYQVVHNATLYSDSFYNKSGGSSVDEATDLPTVSEFGFPQRSLRPFDPTEDPSDRPKKGKKPHHPHKPHHPRKAHFHFDLTSLLHDIPISVDINRVGPFIGMSVNRISRVLVADGVAKDGVLHVVSNVLIPKKPKPKDGEEGQFWEGEEMSVEEFQERLEPYVVDDDDERPEL